eukprot:169795_1
MSSVETANKTNTSKKERLLKPSMYRKLRKMKLNIKKKKSKKRLTNINPATHTPTKDQMELAYLTIDHLCDSLIKNIKIDHDIFLSPMQKPTPTGYVTPFSPDKYQKGIEEMNKEKDINEMVMDTLTCMSPEESSASTQLF